MHPEYLLILLLILVFNSIEADAVKTKAKKSSNKPVELNLNSSYYKQPFRPCTLRRKMNPVESVRAQAYATRVFSKCGSKTIVKHCEVYKMPAYALQGAGNALCIGAYAAYAIIADDGTVVLKTEEQVRQLIELVKMLFGALLKVHHVMWFRLGKLVHTMPAEHFIPFAREVADCAIFRTGSVQLDADYILHTVGYYKFILL